MKRVISIKNKALGQLNVVFKGIQNGYFKNFSKHVLN